MSKVFKIFAYTALFIFSFFLFFYWFFPYDAVKDRVISQITSQLGSNLDVQVKDFSPYWFTGFKITGLTISEQGKDAPPLLTCKRARLRASIFSLIVGRPNVSFYAELGKGEVSGSFNQTDEGLLVEADLNNFDFSSIKLISSSIGLDISSKIDGEVSLKIDKTNPLKSTGKVSISVGDLKSAAGDLKIGEVVVPLPEVIFSKGRDSQIKLVMDKGAISVDAFKFTGGDLALDVKGKVFLSSKLENYRFNLNGAFGVSKKISDALPFLFIIEQQKQADGTYPISITGRVVKPSIKVGTFTVPI